MSDEELAELRIVTGTVFAIDQTATHDGPGLRMTVFLKGCPLRCVWCHSPESQRRGPEIVWYSTRCLSCGACAEACPEQIRGFDPLLETNREACRMCETCLQVCPADAVEVKGHLMLAGEVADQAVRQRAFFDSSGGGVTLTGGEPTQQARFCSAVLRLLRVEGIHTAIETSGVASWETFADLLPLVDLFLFDLKHAEDALHRRDTGVSNHLILDNLTNLVARGAEVLVRVPCIPGRNGTPKAVAGIAAAAKARGVQRISLLPYNPATPGKYAWLQRAYPLDGIKTQTPAEMAALEAVAASVGLEVVAT